MSDHERLDVMHDMLAKTIAIQLKQGEYLLALNVKMEALVDVVDKLVTAVTGHINDPNAHE